MKNILSILLILACQYIGAATYYVATNGNDNTSGGITTPWATWQKGFNTAEAGDTVYFRGGTWSPTTYFLGNYIVLLAPRTYTGIYEGTTYGHSGTAQDPICFFNYPGEKPILDCSNVDMTGYTFNSGLALILADYIHLRGLTVSNVYQPISGNLASGIGASQCSNITFENMTVHDIGGRGFSYWSTIGYYGITVDTSRWINCDAYNCADLLSAEPGNGADGWKFDAEEGAYFYLKGCRSWNNTDDGFDVSGSGVCVYDSCWAFNMGFEGALDGNGFKFGAVRDSLSYPARIIHNNLAAFNKGSGFYDLEYANYYRNNSRIYNNTSYKNTYGYSGSTNAPKPWAISQYRNNISYQNTQIADLGTYTPYDENHNTWDATPNNQEPFNVNTDTVTVTDADFISVDSTGLAGARGSDGSLPVLDFLKLANTSDLVDAGTTMSDVTISYKGVSPDIGYNEYDNSGTDILSFSLPEQQGSATISYTVHTISIEVIHGTDVTDLTPTITISSGATIDPLSGVSRDFTTPQSYMVTAEDGITLQEWAVSITVDQGERFIKSNDNLMVDASGNLLKYTLTQEEAAPEDIPVTSITVTGTGDATTITANDGTLQMVATVLPVDATDNTVTWSKTDGTGEGTISSGGLLTAVSDGTVTARATANDGSGIYGEEEITISNQTEASVNRIIANHTIVDRFDDIPQRWIDSVKTRWVSIAGASHGMAYGNGCDQLEVIDSKFQVENRTGGTPEGPTSAHFRISEAIWGNYENETGWQYYDGQWDFWTNSTARTRIKAGLQYCKDNNFGLYGMLYGWSFDAVQDNAPSGDYDGIYHVRWAGRTVYGPEGNRIWGLDDNDQTLTSNSVSMETYISTMNEYIDYCADNHLGTKMIWSTGAVDGEQSWNLGERGYQAYLKWQYIRDYVNTQDTAYFIDYADILSYNDAGEAATTTWTDSNGDVQTFPMIHADNMGGTAVAHIGEVGALRLGKAMWWMLARMAGWDGN